MVFTESGRVMVAIRSFARVAVELTILTCTIATALSMGARDQAVGMSQRALQSYRLFPSSCDHAGEEPAI